MRRIFMIRNNAVKLGPKMLLSSYILSRVLNGTRGIDRENSNGMWVGAYSDFTNPRRVC